MKSEFNKGKNPRIDNEFTNMATNPKKKTNPNIFFQNGLSLNQSIGVNFDGLQREMKSASERRVESIKPLHVYNM